MISVAEHLEAKGELEKAVQLYQKAGEVTRALELCFRAGGEGEGGGSDGHRGRPVMFEALKAMTDDIGTEASPQASYFSFRVQITVPLHKQKRTRASDDRSVSSLQFCDDMSDPNTRNVLPEEAVCRASLGKGRTVRANREDVPGCRTRCCGAVFLRKRTAWRRSWRWARRRMQTITPRR